MDYDFNKDQILNNDLPNKVDKITEEASKVVEQKIEEAVKVVKTQAPVLTGKNIREQSSGDRVQNIINQFDKSSQSSIRGYELDDRYRNRANKNVSNIVGKGQDTVGTTEGAMQDLVKEANAKGYQVIFTKKNDSTIDINLVPMEKYTTDTADYGDDKINFNIKVGSQGRIAGGKVNAVSLHTEFYDSDELDSQGKPVRKAALRLETAETRQIKNIINRLPTYKDAKDKRSNKKIGQYLQSKAAEAIHKSPQPGSLGYNKAEYEDEELDNLRKFTGKLSEIEAMRSTNYTIDEYLTSVMTSNSGIQKFFEDYINRNNKSKTRKRFNPRKPGSQISNALIEAYHIAMKGVDSKKLEAMPDDNLVKMILKGGGEGNPFGYMLRDAETMGRVLGADYTGQSEGKYGRAIVQTTSSRNFTPTGEMYDYTQRSLSQRYGNMSLTDRAKELRNRAESVSGKNTMVTQRGQWADINYDSEEHNTYGVKFVSQEEYNQAQRQYFKEKGYTDEQTEMAMKDLTDSIIIAKNVIDEMEGWQLNSSEALHSEELNQELLATLGITPEQMEEMDSIQIEGGYIANGSEFWSKNFGLNAGDKIVSLEKTVDNGWKLIVERLRVLKDGSKMVTNWGNRVTKQGNDDYSEWMINHFGGNGGQNFQAIMLENNDLKERNYANYFGGMLSQIQELSRQMDIPLEELFKSLTEMFPMLDKMFEISKDGTKLVDVMKLDEKHGYITSDRANGENIFGNVEDTATMFKGLDSFGLQLFGDKWDSSIRRMEVLQHDVYPYEDPSGYGSATTLERYGRVNDDYKVRDARMRNMNFVGFEAVKNASEESKGDIQRGLDILKEQQQKRDQSFGKKGKAAQLSRQQLQAAVKSIDSSSGYIAEQGVKDVEFISKASLNGEEALENQLVIEDLMTDFSELVENGMLSPDDYSTFAMEIARQKLVALSENDAAYKNGHIVFDGSSMLPGGKKIIMGDIAGSMSPGGKYFPSETDTYNSKILEAAKNGDKTELRTAIQNARDKYSYIADNKDSQVYRDATHNYVPYSSFMIADSGALGIDLNKVTDADLNTAWMSKERYADQIRTAQNGTTKDRIQNIKNLFQNYKLRSSEDYKKQSREDKDLFYEDLYKKTDEELIALEEKIIKWITDSIESGNRNYTTEMGRYPYTQGMEGNKMRVGFDNTLGNDKVKLSAGMLASLRGDTDGDKLRMALGFGDYSGYSKADKEKGFAAEQEMLKYYDRYARVMEEMVQSDYKKDPGLAQREESLDKIAADLESRITNLEASREAKGSFTQIGMFSNAATNMRRSLDATGFATGDLSTQEGKVHAFQSGVIRALLETFEQEAISSKKIYARIKGANADISDEQAYDEVQSLAAQLQSGDFQGFMGSADKLGILGDLLNGKQFRSLRGQWAATQDTDFLKSMESLYGINGFFGSDNLDTKANKANLMNMISGSFGSFEEYLGHGRNLKDAFEYNQKIDSEERVDHSSRKDFTYEKGGPGGPGGPNGPGGPGGPGGPNGPNGPGGPFIINTTNTVEVNGAEVNIEGANINGNIGGTTNAHKAGEATAPNQVNLKNESGEYVFKTNNNAKAYKHVTEIQQPYHEPVSPYDTKGLKAAALGTYAHSMVEELVKTGNDYVEELTDGVKEAEEQLTRPYEQGGAGMDVNEHDIALRRRQAEISAKLAREKGLVNSTSLTERNVKASLGGENISGTSDLLTFNKDENGNYTGVTLSDWKFSSKGGEDDPGQRALRVVQASTYVRMQEAKYAEALKRVQEGQKLEQSEIADLGLEGENTEEQNKDLEAKLKAFSNAKIAIIRSFIKDEDIYNDIAEGTALSGKEVGEATEAMINKSGIRTSDYLKSAGLVTSYAKNGNQINRPDFVKMPGQYSGSGSNGIINQYVANQKAQYRVEEDIARAEARGKSYTGEQAANNDQYIAALRSRLTLLKQQQSQIDINSLSEEDQLKLQSKLNNATSEHSVKLAQVNVNLKEQKSLLEKFAGTIGQRIHSFFDFSLAYMAINKLRQGLQTLINTTTELDSKLVNLQIAIGGTREETHDLLQSYVSLAKELGRTVSEVADAANSWYRSGYRGAEAMELTKASMQLSTLGMIDSANATSYLVSALKGWKLEAAEVSEVVDKLVTLDMNAAVSAGELAEAMSRANNSARLAGVSMNTYMGYLTTVIDTTQKSAESVGQSFQTIFSRFQNIKAGKFAASYEDTQAEGYSEDNFEALNDVETVLNRVGVKVRDNASEWRNIEDVIDEIADKWSGWDKTTQNAVASAVAGTRQRENVVTLFTNYDEVAKYAEIATDSYGNAKEKMEAYTDSVEAAKKKITTATEEWALKLNQADAIKKFYKIIASLVENLDKVLIGGGLIAVLTNLGGAANLVSSGLSKIGNSLFSLGTSSTFGLDQYKGGFANLKNQFNNPYNAALVDQYNASLAQYTATLGSANVATAQSMQSTLLGMKEETAGTIIKAAKRSVDEQRIAVGLESLTADEMDTLTTMLLTTTEGQRAQQEYNNILTSQSLDDQELRQIVALEVLQKVWDRLAQSGGRLANEVDQNTAAFAKSKNKGFSTALAGAASIGGMALGSYGGEKALETIGIKNSGMIGTMLGGMAGSAALKTLATGASWKAAGAGISGLLAGTTSAGAAGMAAGPIVAAIAAGIALVVGAIKAKKEKDEAKKLEEAQTKFKEAEEALTSAKSAISTAKKVEELSKGVDALGRNVSLSEDDYASFLENSNKLAETFPEMVSRVDEAGNKIVKLGNVSEETASKVSDLQKVSDEALLKSNIFADATSQLHEEQDGYQKQIDELEEEKGKIRIKGQQKFATEESQETYKFLMDNGKVAENGEVSDQDQKTLETYDNNSFLANQMVQIYNDLYDKYYDADNPAWSQGIAEISVEDAQKWSQAANTLSSLYGFDPESMMWGNEGKIDSNKVPTENGTLYLSKLDVENLGNGIPGGKSQTGFVENQEDAEIAIQSKDAAIAELEQAKKESLKQFDDYLNAVLRTKTHFSEQSAEVQNIILSTMSGLIVPEDTGDPEKDLENYINKVKETYKELSSFLNKNPAIIDVITEVNTADTAGEARDARNNLKEELINALGGKEALKEDEEGQAIMLKFGFQYDESKNDFTDIEDTLSLFEQTEAGKFFSKKFNLAGRTQDEVKKAYDLWNSGTVNGAFSNEQLNNLIRSDLSGGNTVQEAIGYQAQLLAAAPSLDQRLEEFYNSNKNSRREVTSSMVAKEFSDLPENLRNSILEGANEIREGTKETSEVISENFDEYSTSLLNSKMNVAKTLAAKTFSGIDAGQDGIIGEWSELADMLDQISASYEKLKSAQQEQNATGKLSWQTTLGLLNTNIEYINALEVTENGIRLKKDAEEQMAKVQIATARANIQAKIAELEAENADIDAKLQNYETTGTLVESSNAQIDANAALVESLNTLADAYANTAAYARDLTAAEHGSEESTVTGKVTAEHVDAYREYVEYSGDAAKQRADALRAQRDENVKTIDLLKQFDLDMSKVEESGYAYETFDKLMNTPDGSGSPEDRLNKLKALVGSLNKEYQQWLSLVEKGNKTLSSTDSFMNDTYYSKLEEYLTAEAKEELRLYNAYKGKDDEKAFGYWSNYQETILKIKNLDDERVQDRITILENQKASASVIRAEYQNLLATADTYEERIEYQQKLNDAILDELNMEKEILEARKDYNELRMEYTSVGEAGYDSLAKKNVKYAKDILENAKEYYSTAWDQTYTATGDEDAADREAAKALSNVISAQQAYSEAVFKPMKDQVDYLTNKIELLERSKPEEWNSEKSISDYYSSVRTKATETYTYIMSILNDTSKRSELTDEQIKELVEDANTALEQMSNKLEELNDIKAFKDEQYTAITDTVNQYIKDIEKQKEVMEDYYDTEIEKLQDKQTSIERTNKLIELQNNLLDAQQQKERVYREGKQQMPLSNYIG